jgi:hypothetical protein
MNEREICYQKKKKKRKKEKFGLRWIKIRDEMVLFILKEYDHWII